MNLPTLGPGYTIRPMQRAELNTAMQWAAAEGWNPGLDDAQAFFATDSTGFLVGLLDGVPIASISVVAYGASYGFLGLYIVRPEYRGQGYGLALWQAGMAQLEGRAVGLDGVVAQQPNYRRSGFVLAHRNIRYHAAARNFLSASQNKLDIVPVSSLAWSDLLAYDRAFFPEARAAFLYAWLRPRAGQAWACTEAGAITGYGVLRQCLQGYKIGPLFANRADQAQALLAALVARIPPDSSVYLDVPEVHANALALAQRYDMTPMFETARMYKGTPALPDMQRTYGITTFELG